MSAPREMTRTPGIYRRGSRYTFQYRKPNGERAWATAATLAEARVKRAGLTADVARGEFTALSTVTFTEYAETWLASYTGRRSSGIGPSTLDDYRRAIGIGRTASRRTRRSARSRSSAAPG